MPESSQPLVTVVMNCLNCEKYLKEAIDSVYAQTYQNWEIIFWDNASTDSSAEIAKGYDNKLRYFKGEETIPLGAARNQAIEKSKGKYIAFLDCDDLWMPEKLERQVPAFIDDNKVGIVICDTIFFNSTRDIKQLYKHSKPPSGFVFDELLTDYFISMETAVIRRKALDNLSEWFDESFNMIEERDLFTRISYNWKLFYVEQVLSKWRMHTSSWTFSRRSQFVEEFEKMFVKYQELYPGLEKEHPRGVRALRAKIAMHNSLNAWEEGDSRAARGLLRPYLGVGPRYFFLYLLTYLPFLFYNKINRLRGVDPS